MPSNASAGFNAVIEVSTDGGTVYTPVLEVRDFKLKRGRKLMDATSHSSGGDEESKPGNRNWSATAEALRVHSDAGQGVVEAALESGAELKIRYRPKGTGAGRPQKIGSILIEDMEEAAPNSDLLATNISFRGTGPLVTSNQ